MGTARFSTGRQHVFKSWSECVFQATELNDLTYAAYHIIIRIPKILNKIQRAIAAKGLENEMASKRKGFMRGEDLLGALAALKKGEAIKVADDAAGLAGPAAGVPIAHLASSGA